MIVAREQRNPDWNWIKRDKQSILKTSRFASPTFHRWRPILLFLSLFFVFFLFFFFSTSVGAKGDLRYLWERPTVREAPAFHLQLDQPRQTIDRLSRVLRVRQRSASCHCSSWTRDIIRIPNHPMNQRRYPACTDTHVCVYIYICKIDARIVRTLTLLHRAFATIALAIVWSRGVVRASMQVVFIPIDYGDYTSWPDTRARNSRNPNATGKLPSKNPTLEFHWTKCHHRVLTWTRRNGS